MSRPPPHHPSAAPAPCCSRGGGDSGGAGRRAGRVQDAAATELTTGLTKTGRRRRWREQRNEAAALEGDARTIAALLLGASHPFVAEIEAEIEALARNADHAQQRASCGKRPREHTDEGI